MSLVRVVLASLGLAVLIGVQVARRRDKWNSDLHDSRFAGVLAGLVVCCLLFVTLALTTTVIPAQTLLLDANGRLIEDIKSARLFPNWDAQLVGAVRVPYGEQTVVYQYGHLQIRLVWGGSKEAVLPLMAEIPRDYRTVADWLQTTLNNVVVESVTLPPADVHKSLEKAFAYRLLVASRFEGKLPQGVRVEVEFVAPSAG